MCFLNEDESLLTRELTIPATTGWDMGQDRYSLAHGHSRFSLSDWPWGNFHKQFPLDTDHSGLVKFSTQWDDAYQQVLSTIKELIISASKVVDRRFSLVEGAPKSQCHAFLKCSVLIYSQDLLPEEKRRWMELNEPPYNAFRDSENLIKPEKETLRWLVELDDFRPKESPESGPSLSSYDFIKW